LFKLKLHHCTTKAEKNILNLGANMTILANMTDAECEQSAERARTCWEYAKTRSAVYNPNFKSWFQKQAKWLYWLDDAEIAKLWEVAMRMYS
jgi:hypothetical protein